MNPSALILAAGASQRMGRDKAALPWLEDQSLLEWMAGALHRAGWKTFAVLGPHNHAAWSDGLPNAGTVLNSQANEGKTTSLAAGARALPASASHVLITAVDQPRPPALYRQLRIAAGERSESVIVPDCSGHRGHPVVLVAGLIPRLLELSEGSLGLRRLLDEQADSTFRLPCDPTWSQWDCNTPESYRAARRWFESHGESGNARTEIIRRPP